MTTLNERVRERLKIVLLGYPVRQSLSPVIHHAAAESLKIPLDYGLYPVHAQELPAVLQNIRANLWQGANITQPHKHIILPFIDTLSPLAQRIGAVNTLLLKGDTLYGENTDAPAFHECLLRQLDFQPKEEHVLLLGAGGAARAALIVLLDAGVRHIHMWNRTADKGEKLIRECAQESTIETVVQSVTTAMLADLLPDITLIINATSIGHTNENQPLDPQIVSAQTRIFDMVYRQGQTRFVQNAQACGLIGVDGLWMLVRQAARSFWLWTGQQPSEELMYAAAVTALDKQTKGFSEPSRSIP